MMTAMFLMAFDAVVIAAPISLQVLMLPYLYYEFHTVAPFIYCVFCLFAPGDVLVGCFVYVVGNLLTHKFARTEFSKRFVSFAHLMQQNTLAHKIVGFS